MCRTVNNFTSLKQNWKAVDQRQLLKPKWISEQPEFFRMDFPLLSKTGKLFFTRLLYSFFSLSQKFEKLVFKRQVLWINKPVRPLLPALPFKQLTKYFSQMYAIKNKTTQLLFKPLAQTGWMSWASHLAHTC